jgi:lipopolysaccharide export system permease protein
MKWDTAKRNWQLTNAMERKVEAKREIVNIYPTYNIDLHLKPGDLKYDYYLKDKLTTSQLVNIIHMEEERGTEGLNTLKVERYRRSATPVSVFLLSIIGAIIASRKTRGGSGLHIAIGLIIAAIFILADKFSSTFSVKGDLHPLLAAWVPNLFFTIVCWWLFRKAPK